MKKFLTIAALAVLGAAALPHSARAQGPVTYTPGDLFLSFRASQGVGATQNYVVNLGQASKFGATGSSAVVAEAGNIATDLTALYGANWKTRSDVFWSVSGTVGSFNSVGSDPAKTLYATREQPVPGTLSTPWLRRSDSTQGITTSKMNAMANAYAGKTSTAANPKAIIQSASAANSYASFQPGGTPENSGPAPGVSFAAFNPTIEGTFGSGTAGSVLDLVRLVPAAGADIGTAGGIVGRFTLSDSGEISYTPAGIGATSVSVALASYSVVETAGTVAVKLVRSGNPSTAFTVNFSTANGTAIAGTDYTAQSSVPVSFAANQVEATVQVAILSAPAFQPSRAFTVNISSPSVGATLGTQTSATVTISDAPANSTLAFSAATYAFNARNNSGAPNSLSVQLTRTGVSTGSVSVGVAVTGGTLVNGTDYQTYSPTTVTFADGATTATTTIQLNVINGGGSIVLGLSNPTGGAALGATSTATLNVAAFPGSLSFAAATYQKGEGTGDVTVQISVTRGSSSAGAVSAQVAVTDGTASVGTDYTLPSSPVTLSWANGDNTPKTFNVTVKADTSLEANGETVVLALQNLTGGAVLGTNGTTTLTILDGDTKLPTLSVATPSGKRAVVGSSVLVSGTARDNTGVSRVEVKLNGGAVQLAAFTGPVGNVSWSLNLLPEQGGNTLEVTAYDLQDNASLKVTRKFTWWPSLIRTVWWPSP